MLDLPDLATRNWLQLRRVRHQRVLLPLVHVHDLVIVLDLLGLLDDFGFGEALSLHFLSKFKLIFLVVLLDRDFDYAISFF